MGDLVTYRSSPSFAVGGVSYLDHRGQPTSVTDPTPTGWRCFQCNEHFTDWRAAMRHFGKPTDERQPSCLEGMIYTPKPPAGGDAGAVGEVVDWDRPLEAVHRDGRVVPVTADPGHDYVEIYIRSDRADFAEGYHNGDGTSSSDDGWTVRNSRAVLALPAPVVEGEIVPPENGEPDPEWRAIKRAIDQFVGRVPTISKHRALNNAHIKAVVERLDADGDHEVADTIVWQCWWRALDRERERFLMDDANERIAALSEGATVTQSATVAEADPETVPGRVMWHTSEEGGGPDVGISVGLGGGSSLFIGDLLDRDGGPVGIVFHGPAGARHAARLTELDEVRDLFEHHVAPAIAALSEGRSHG